MTPGSPTKDLILRKNQMVNNSKPKVLVLMATYNGARYLQEQLDSITNQEGVDVHFLFCDDGSTDETLQILKDFSGHWPVIDVLITERVGHPKAFSDLSLNCPLDFDFYAFSDQDDVWESRKLLESIGAFRDQNAKVVGTGRQILSQKKRLDSRVQMPHSPHFSNAIVQNILFGNTCVINKVGLNFLRENLPDGLIHFDGWLYFIFSSCAEVEIIQKPLVKYRIHDANTLGIRKLSSFVKIQKQIKSYYFQAKIGEKYVEKFCNQSDKELLFDFIEVFQEKRTFLKIPRLRNLDVRRAQKFDTFLFKVLILFSVAE